MTADAEEGAPVFVGSIRENTDNSKVNTFKLFSRCPHVLSV